MARLATLKEQLAVAESDPFPVREVDLILAGLKLEMIAISRRREHPEEMPEWR